MTKLKSLLLGSVGAAVVLTSAPAAMAADAPQTPDREPVYRCETTGFWELPGTDTCLKLGGRMRGYAGYQDDNMTAREDWAPGNIGLPNNHSQTDTFWMGADFRLNLDARTQTEYGLLRGFAELQVGDNDENTGGSLNLRHAYVQIGNWLMGKTWSLWTDLSYTNYGGLLTVAGDDYVRVVQARYTQPFGNGFEFAVALEDPARSAGRLRSGPNDADGDPTSDDSRNEIPNLIARLSASGDWGQAYVSGVVVDNALRGTFATGLISDSETGFGVSAGLTLNVPTGEGDSFFVRGSYTDGASLYSGGSLGGVLSVTRNAAGTGWDTVEVTSAIVGFTHNWTPSLNSSIGAGWADIDRADNRVNTTENIVQGFANLYWTPVKNLELGVDVTWAEREIIAAAGADDDEDSFGVMFQATRYF